MQDTAARDKVKVSGNETNGRCDREDGQGSVGDDDEDEEGNGLQCDSEKRASDDDDGSSDDSEGEEGSNDTDEEADEEVCLCHGLLGVIVRNGYNVGGNV